MDHGTAYISCPALSLSLSSSVSDLSLTSMIGSLLLVVLTVVSALLQAPGVRAADPDQANHAADRSDTTAQWLQRLEQQFVQEKQN